MLRRRLSGENYALIAAAIIIAVFGAFLAGRDDDSNAGAATEPVAERAASPTQTATVSSPTPTETTAPTTTPRPTATPAPTATPQPTATPDILAGAKLRTEDDAVAFAFEYARGLGAASPRLVSVELLEIDAAIAKTLGPGDDPGPPWATEGAAGLAWLMQFDNGEFEIPRCPNLDAGTPEADGAGHSCGTLPTAVFVIRASDASVISTSLGPPVPL